MKLTSNKTLNEIASLIGCEFEGNPDFPVTGINEIHKVEKGDLTFVDHPKYYVKALASAATTIIINLPAGRHGKKIACPAGKALIFSENPFRDYNKLTLHFRPFEKATAPVSASARVGEGTVLQPGVFVGNHVIIGNNCIIHANVSIYDHCVIGDNVIIHSGTVIGSDAFYMKKENGIYQKWNSCGRVVIHNNVEIGANCAIDRGVSGDTVIGEGTKMDNLIQIGHDTVIGKNCLFASQVGIAGVVIVEDDVILWGQVGVQKDLTIGKGAVILGQSGIAKSIAGNKIWFGSPVREAREKMKELALIKQLPSILEKLK